MTDTARLETHEHLARPRLGELDVLHDERRAERLQNRGPDPHAQTIRGRWPVTSAGRVYASAPKPGLRAARVGQLLSTTGTATTTIAYPLLVLAATHSPAKAGIVAFARVVP